MLGYSLAAYAMIWGTGLAAFDGGDFADAAAKLYGGMAAAPLLAILFTMSFGVVQSAASALGEEIGWRGFLVSALAIRIGTEPALLASGVIWAVWHFPLIICANYNGGAPLAFQLTCFTVMIIATGAIYGIIRLRSGSVWPPTIMHAAHNALIQWLLDPMTVETGRGAWFAGEFGAALAVTTTVAAVLVLRGGPAPSR